MAAALLRMRAAVQRLLGPPAGAAFVSITALQFHLPFYASRTLPNVFALAAASLAHADWLEGSRPLRAIALLAFTTVSIVQELSSRSTTCPWTGSRCTGHACGSCMGARQWLRMYIHNEE